MPDLPLSLTGSGSFGSFGGASGTDWGAVIRGGLDVLGGLFGGGSGMGLQLPGGTSMDLPGADLWPGDPMSNAMWKQGMTGYRQVTNLVVPSPDGKLGFWEAKGRPLVWSRDYAAVRRLRKFGARAVSATGGNRRGRRRRGGR